jgi:hypothetical protein
MNAQVRCAFVVNKTIFNNKAIEMNTATQVSKPDVLDKASGCVNMARSGCILVFFNLFLLAFLAWGGFHAYSSWQLVSSGEKATGTVIALSESDSDGSTVYSPVIEFTANGKTVSFEGSNASSPPVYDIGEEVKLLYDPAAPEQARVNSFYELWLFPIIIIPAMLLTMLIVNLVYLIALLRGKMTSNG